MCVSSQGQGEASSAPVSLTGLPSPAFAELQNQFLSERPRPKTGVGVQVPGRTNDKKVAAPGRGHPLRDGQLTPRIIRARDQQTAERQRMHWNRMKVGDLDWGTRRVEIGRCDEQGCMSRSRVERCPMRDCHAPEAVRDQERWRATRDHVFIQARHPRSPFGLIPILLLDTDEISMSCLEPGLPVVRPRVGPARDDEDRGRGGQFRGILCAVRAEAVSNPTDAAWPPSCACPGDAGGPTSVCPGTP